MQIAVTISDEKVDEIDGLVPSLFRSRAEVVRVAVDELLRSHRRRVVDAQYRAGLDAAANDPGPSDPGPSDPGPSDPGPRTLGAGDPEPLGWADIPW